MSGGDVFGERHRREGLGRGSQEPLELMTEVGLIAKMKLGRNGFVQPTFRNVLARDATPKLARPDLGSAIEALPEKALQLPYGNGAHRGHGNGSKFRPLG